MELAKWRRRRHVPVWGGNSEDPEPCTVVFLPPTIGWISRWRELALQAPMVAKRQMAALERGEDLPQEWDATMAAFREELLRELIVKVEDINDENGALSLDAALEFIIANPGLRDEVFQAIIAQGQITPDESKG